MSQDFTGQTKELIDNLKGVFASYGLGNDGNEFKIITQVFLYKFMNDKFGYEVKQIGARLRNAVNWERKIAKYTEAIPHALPADESRQRPIKAAPLPFVFAQPPKRRRVCQIFR